MRIAPNCSAAELYCDSPIAALDRRLRGGADGDDGIEPRPALPWGERRERGGLAVPDGRARAPRGGGEPEEGDAGDSCGTVRAPASVRWIVRTVWTARA